MNLLTITLNTIWQHPNGGWVMLITGLAIRLLIQQRRFKRRGLGGLQHFNNFFVGLLTLFLEWVLKWSAIALIVMGIIKIIT